MEKLLVYVFVVLGSAILCSGATQYLVGDNSGWDISTNLDAWAQDKTFNVGDVLVFQYSSSHSVSEVTRENFDRCNTTNALQTLNSGGNSTVTLKEPGDRYFVCGNRLHCLGGMRLKLKVEANQTYAPAGAPQAATGPGGGTNSDYPNPASKTNKQDPASTASFGHGGRSSVDVMVFLLVVLFPWF